MIMTVTPVSPVIIDALGQPCPMPLLLLKRALKKADQQSKFLLKSSDPHSEIDVTRYCQLHQLHCRSLEISAKEYHYYIELM
jgi:tRNA 2-thiouridine synthesizing protein A